MHIEIDGELAQRRQLIPRCQRACRHVAAHLLDDLSIDRVFALLIDEDDRFHITILAYLV